MTAEALCWRTLWGQDGLMRHPFWDSQMRVFLRESAPVAAFGPEDTVLDLGCGPGALAAQLRGRVRGIVGVDTAGACVTYCRERLGGGGDVSFHALGEAYTRLEFLPAAHFTRIIALSVLHYYRGPEELAELFAQLRRVARPGAIGLFADLPMTAGGMAGDIAVTFASARREGCVLECAGFLLRTLASGYLSARLSQSMLSLPAESWLALARQAGLEAEIIDRDLTFNPNRGNLLVRF